jgi:hypothetical protein
MPRNITITFDDGTSHQYAGVPDNVTPEQVHQRATQEHGKAITNIDGGNMSDSAYSQKPSESSSMASGRGAGGFTGGVLSALQGPTLGFLDEAAGVGSGVLSTLQGKGYPSGYESGRDYVRGAVKQHEEDYPIGSQVARGISSLPLAFIPGGQARTATTLAKALQAAKVGAGYGAAQGVGESTAEDIVQRLGGDALSGAALSAVTGGALSGIGSGIGAVGSNVAQRMSQGSAGQVAREKLAEALGRDARGTLAQTPGALTNATDMAARRMQKLGPEATIADAGGASSRQLLDTLATLPGRTKQLAEGLIRERQSGRAGRLSAAADESLGTKGAGYQDTIQSLIDRKVTEAAPLYKQLEGMSVRVDPELSGLLKAADSAHGGAELLSKLRQEVPINISALKAGDDIPFAALDKIKQSLYDLGETSKRAGNKEVSAAYNKLRISLTNKMDDLSPKNEAGSIYKQARNAFSGPAQLQDAVESGRGAMKTDAIGVSDMMKGMTQDQVEAFKVGALQSLRDKVGTESGQTSLLKMWKEPATSGKLKEIFGNDYKKFAADVAREARLKELEAVGRGSQTASRLYAAGDLDAQPISNAAQVATSIGSGQALPAIAGSARGIAGMWNKVRMPEATRDEMARLLMMRGQGGQQELQNLKPMMDRLAAERLRRASATGIGAGQISGGEQ